MNDTPSSFMDFFDIFMGKMNFLDNLFGYIHRGATRSRGGRMGPVVQIKFRRVVKGGNYVCAEVAKHLNKYGVRTFHHGYNHRYRWFYVRKSQEKFARWLFDGETLRTPKRAWKDKTR